MKKQSLAALALVAGSAISSNVLADDCDVVIYGPQYGVHSGGAGYDASLWPPNHKMVTVAVEAMNEDCDVDITGVFQDEALDMEGSGNTTERDAENCYNGGKVSTVDLRAERSGRGSGRFYEIDWMATHESDPGNSETGRFVVLVPHDQRRDQSQWENDIEGAEDDMRIPSGAMCGTGPNGNGIDKGPEGNADDADTSEGPAKNSGKGKGKA